MDIYDFLADIANGKIKITVGLVQQGYIPTIEVMLKNGKTWDDIGTAIGWDGETAQKWYEWYQNN